ncbi:hypothetical protein AbraIFM66951_007262 [Aspergillus brasiliensis]|uniref:Uncharacterized protein n=1 Tax=Aspergillus brasiliensis TaxID=319629 RepID=A0A9W5YQC2_9EURO|nr:hypothetical protein AbraCBS73388_007896 [Aspergillus brasiliensis]GKZ44917.1 hypothetical protein AbraIFM66951_007262 [Aspergillus brasiliensis]
MARTRQSGPLEDKSEDRKPSQDDNQPEETDRVYPSHDYFLSREEYYDVLAECNWMASNEGTKRCLIDLVHRQYSRLQCTISNWTHHWTRRESMSHLQPDEKQAIITSLDGYCVQEDWDSITPLLPPGTRANMGPVLGNTMLYQFIFAKLIDTPFWFLDGKKGPTDVDGDPEFHLRLQYLYERLREASAYKAVWWKSVTIGESNAHSGFDGIPARTVLAQGTAAQRTAMVKSLTDELLGRRVFQLLLRPLDSEKDVASRHKQLQELVQEAVDITVYTEGGMFGHTTVERLPDLPIYFRDSESMRAHTHHAASSWNTPRFAPSEGGRVLIMTRPGLVYSHMRSLGQGFNLPPHRVLKAEALVVVKPPPTKKKKTVAARKGSTSGVVKPAKGKKGGPRAKKPSPTPSAVEAKDATEEDGKDRKEPVRPGGRMKGLRSSFWRR